MDKLLITDIVNIDESELSESLMRASGPGGRNVSKASTAAKQHFWPGDFPALSKGAKKRLTELTGRCLAASGELESNRVIFCRKYRTQEMNGFERLQHLVQMGLECLEPPKTREPIKFRKASIRPRLEAHRRGFAVKDGCPAGKS